MSTEINKLFRWRDRTGEFHTVGSMETRHLFHVFRMIWNHTAPDHMKLWPYNEYQFNPFYTAAYLEEAVFQVYCELEIRNDMTADWKRQMDKMRSHFEKLKVTHENRQDSKATRRLTHSRSYYGREG